MCARSKRLMQLLRSSTAKVFGAIGGCTIRLRIVRRAFLLISARAMDQRTDKHFSHFLGIARGECNEIRTHFAAARRRKHVREDEAKELSDRYIVIGKMATNLMKYLDIENRRQRG
jgi:hypothetical protein